jgi:hypothetical protein
MGDATANLGDEDRLAPLKGLVDRLRAEVTELQGGREALGEELRARLRLSEATRAENAIASGPGDLMESGQEGVKESALASQEGAEALHAREEEEGVSQAAVAELQGRWEAMGEELEAKRRRLTLAEATLNLTQSEPKEETAPALQETGPAGGGLHAGEEEGVSKASQASVGIVMRSSRWRHVPDCTCIQQAGTETSAAGKRPRPSAPGDRSDEGPRLSLVTALPLSVWQEHLPSLLHQRQVARLRVTCKALKVLAMELPMTLYLEFRAEDLEAALTSSRLPST